MIEYVKEQWENCRIQPWVMKDDCLFPIVIFDEEGVVGVKMARTIEDAIENCIHDFGINVLQAKVFIECSKKEQRRAIKITEKHGDIT